MERTLSAPYLSLYILRNYAARPITQNITDESMKLGAEHVERTALVLDRCSVQDHREYTCTNFN